MQINYLRSTQVVTVVVITIAAETVVAVASYTINHGLTVLLN